MKLEVRPRSIRRGGFAVALPLVALFFLVAPAVHAQAPAEAEIVVALEFQPDAVEASMFLQDQGTEVVFRKEPGRLKNALRAAIVTGPNRRKDFIGIAFDKDRELLYIDRNRNLDLTDDGEPQSLESNSYDYDDSEPVLLEVPEGDGTRAYRFQTNWHTDFGSYSFIRMRSAWVGAFDVDGRKQAIAFVDDFDGILSNDDQFALKMTDEAIRLARGGSGPSAGSESYVYVNAPGLLGLNGAIYQARIEWRVDGGEARPDLVLTRWTGPTIDLKTSCDGVQWLGLVQGEWKYGAPLPQARIVAPAGSMVERVLLEVGYDSDNTFAPLPLESFLRVSGGQQEFTAGEPLHEGILAHVMWSTVNLDYSLTGQGGETYAPSLWNMPRFEVRNDGKIVHTGDFDYG